MPPYKFVDKATNLPVVTDGKPWDNIDVAAGQKVQIWLSPPDTWKLISPGTFTRPDVAIVAPAATGGGLAFPQNEAEFIAELKSSCAAGRVAQFDGRTAITLTQPVVIPAPATGGEPWGINGNYMQLRWGGPQDADMVTFQGTGGVFNRGLVVENLALNGGGTNWSAWHPARACLRLSAPGGDVGSLYKFTVRNVYTMEASYGFIVEGAVFEGMFDNFHAENHSKDGYFAQHIRRPDGGLSVVSNIVMNHANLSRNMGAGARVTYSHNFNNGSFILNGESAITAPEGCRTIAFCNAENSGEAAFRLASNGYGSSIVYNEISGDCYTHARRFDNGAWVDVGKPMLYMIEGAPGVFQTGNHCSFYGSGVAGAPTTNQMRVVK